MLLERELESEVWSVMRSSVDFIKAELTMDLNALNHDCGGVQKDKGLSLSLTQRALYVLDDGLPRVIV